MTNPQGEMMEPELPEEGQPEARQIQHPLRRGKSRARKSQVPETAPQEATCQSPAESRVWAGCSPRTGEEAEEEVAVGSHVSVHRETDMTAAQTSLKVGRLGHQKARAESPSH